MNYLRIRISKIFSKRLRDNKSKIEAQFNYFKNWPTMKKIIPIIIGYLCFMCGTVLAEGDVAIREITIKNNLEPQIERGQPNCIIDSVGNVASIPQKVILLNPNIDSHIVSQNTEQYLKDFIRDNPEAMKDVKVRINKCSPIQELDRLVKNKHVSLIWRIFPGIPVTIWSSLTGRILGGDNYNPYTNTISIYSNDPAVVLHEACHAKDFMSRVTGLETDAYAVGRVFSPVALYQEFTASDEAIDYLKKKGDSEAEKHSYATLYPAFGTYGGAYTGIPYGNIIGAFVGHGAGLWKGYEYRLCQKSVKFGDVCRNLESDPLAGNLLVSERENNESLYKELYSTK